MGWKTGRDHHLLSDHERRLFYLFEWSDNVVDIKEQLPMLELDLAMKTADDMGWTYPSEVDVPYILTTDFMLTVKRNGKLVQIARTVEMAQELDKESIAARLYPFDLSLQQIASGIPLNPPY